VVVLLGLLAGCSSIDAALSRDWAVVIFKQNANVTELLQVRAACAHLPNVVLQAPPSGKNPLTAIYALRYDTSNASPADIVRLRDCLQRFKSVAGVTFQNALPPGTDGG
jgi:hypothetical protein